VSIILTFVLGYFLFVCGWRVHFIVPTFVVKDSHKKYALAHVLVTGREPDPESARRDSDTKSAASENVSQADLANFKSEFLVAIEAVVRGRPGAARALPARRGMRSRYAVQRDVAPNAQTTVLHDAYLDYASDGHQADPVRRLHYDDVGDVGLVRTSQ
jgi:hypothetical protein